MTAFFVALSIPEVVADALTQLQSGLDGAAWTHPDDFHLTLAYIGEADRRQLEEVGGALAGILAPGFELTLSGCGFFGGARPRAVWAAVERVPTPVHQREAPLSHLQDKVDSALRRAGVKPPSRKFTPHVTLGYVRGVSQEAVSSYCAMHNLFKCGPFPVRAFHLYSSDRRGEGPYYDIVESYPLSSMAPLSGPGPISFSK